MRKPVFTTQKTNIGYLVSSLMSDIIFVVIGIVCSQKAADLRAYWRFDEAESMGLLSTMCFIVALLSFVYHIMVSATCADIYSNGIIGKGLQGITLKNFKLRLENITNISSSKGFLNMESGSGVFLMIDTDHGSYKVITTADCAGKITNYWNSTKGDADRME